MIESKNMLRVCAFILFSSLTSSLLMGQPTAKLVSVQKIWDKAPHNAFTDLIRFQDRWFCVFREASSHVSDDGSLRIISSKDGTNWESFALIKSANSDLRDAKISITPNNELMLSGAEALHKPTPHKHRSLAWFSKDGRTWSMKHEIGDPDNWLWRVTWHDSMAYGFGYRTGSGKRGIKLFTSENGKEFQTLVENAFDDGYPNETSIVFMKDERCYCLLRRDSPTPSSQLGSSNPPYKKWRWTDLGTKIGGPHMIAIPNVGLVAAVRLYDEKVRTSICSIDTKTASIKEILKLPSGRDTSYAGLVWHDELLWVSYYSTHEGKTSIYLAKVDIKKK